MGYEVVGTWRQVLHWGPLVALSVIFTISGVTVKCMVTWWPPFSSIAGLLHMLTFLFWVMLTLYNYFLAMLRGPGFVPFGWKLANPDHCHFLQYCEFCKSYKAPRSHHCRKCDRCVMKMDHHCPWINTCCGHMNHGNFCYFLFFAPIGCIHALFVLIPTIFRAMNFHYYYQHRSMYSNEPLVYLTVWGFVIAMFTIGLAIGVIIAVGMLFFIQIKSILKNETAIESWIIDKAIDRLRSDDEGPFIYPYNLGWRKNLKQVFTWSGKPRSDGFSWEVASGCTQFSLTEEQLKQKAEKRERTVTYTIVEPYSGRLFPCSKGLRVACCIPCTDEPRIQLQPGDRVLVTRWKRHWLYGTKLFTSKENGSQQRIRGWFPRQCSKEVIDDNDNMQDKKFD